MKKISVIVPVYKVEKYLNRCIDSIINQTYKNLEIILVDDGSPDNCPAICDEYAKKDGRIKVIHKQNEGVAEARNVGLANSTGNYIVFVDSDDYISEDMCDIYLKVLKQEKADIVVSNYNKVTDGDFICSDKDYVTINFDNKEVLRELYGQNVIAFTVPWGKIYKRELFDGIKYPKGKIHEDEFITYKLLFKTRKVSYINWKPYCYFQRDDSIMGKRISVDNLATFEALEERKRFLFENDLTELVPYNDRTMFFYCIELYNSFKYQKKKEQVLKLRNKMTELYRNVIRHNDLDLLRKIKYTVVYFWPGLYSMIYKNKRVRD